MKNAYWYGYLEAGAKSSLVARDPNLDTGDTQTVYLYNYSRDQIKEYKLSIVEPKLRDLSTEESKELKSLEQKFKAALSAFKVRPPITATGSEQSKSSTAESKQKATTLDDDYSDDVDSVDVEDWDDDAK